MSVNLHYPQAMNALTDLQIYNNAVFDNVENQITPSCSPVKSVSFSDISKENQSPASPLNPNPNGNSRVKLMKEVRDEKKIDIEIEVIEKEISRLSERLKVLKLEKEQKNGKLVERRVRIVPAKFMEQKQNVRSDCNLADVKKSDENLSVSVKSKGLRRGVSMCPGEILAGANRRGLSLGPSEIAAGSKFRQMYKPEVMPVESSLKNRRKSCFLKLGDVDEMRVIKERGKSCSLSPKSRKALNKTQGARQVLTTVGARKGVKKDDGLLAAIQPKNLFKDGEKSVAAKKPVKSGRVIASRYNQGTILSAMRKRSLPENDRDEGRKCDRKRSLSVGKSRESMPEISEIQGSKSCIKKRWEVPSQTVVVCGNVVVPDVLPKIRTARYTIDTPRDSGAAKRVAELVGKKSFFSSGGDVDSSVCQELSFAEEE